MKLLDFASAKLMPEPHRAVPTKTGVMLGAPEYSRPSKRAAPASTTRTDIYALGLVMF